MARALRVWRYRLTPLTVSACSAGWPARNSSTGFAYARAFCMPDCARATNAIDMAATATQIHAFLCRIAVIQASVSYCATNAAEGRKFERARDLSQGDLQVVTNLRCLDCP